MLLKRFFYIFCICIGILANSYLALRAITGDGFLFVRLCNYFLPWFGLLALVSLCGAALSKKRIFAIPSGTGNCYDNASMENFWATLKTELVFHRRFATRQQAIREITEYIEVFYNRQRIQKQLGYLSPAAFERRYYEQRLAA